MNFEDDTLTDLDDLGRLADPSLSCRITFNVFQGNPSGSTQGLPKSFALQNNQPKFLGWSRKEAETLGFSNALID